MAFSNLDPTQTLTLRYEVHDGATGAPRGSASVTLPPGGWLQVNNVLSAAGVTGGFVHVTRVSGDAPFAAYGVLNDGASPSAGTDDGSYVGMAASN